MQVCERSSDAETGACPRVFPIPSLKLIHAEANRCPGRDVASPIPKGACDFSASGVQWSRRGDPRLAHEGVEVNRLQPASCDNLPPAFRVQNGAISWPLSDISWAVIRHAYLWPCVGQWRPCPQHKLPGVLRSMPPPLAAAEAELREECRAEAGMGSLDSLAVGHYVQQVTSSHRNRLSVGGNRPLSTAGAPRLHFRRKGDSTRSRPTLC